jgi:hypothetical protein
MQDVCSLDGVYNKERVAKVLNMGELYFLGKTEKE